MPELSVLAAATREEVAFPSKRVLQSKKEIRVCVWPLGYSAKEQVAQRRHVGCELPGPAISFHNEYQCDLFPLGAVQKRVCACNGAVMPPVAVRTAGVDLPAARKVVLHLTGREHCPDSRWTQDRGPGGGSGMERRSAFNLCTNFSMSSGEDTHPPAAWLRWRFVAYGRDGSSLS